jgi:TrmH RNA methyltransferase
MKQSRRQPRPESRPAPRAAAAGKRGRPRHRSKAEEMFHGVRACQAIFECRPQDIVRVYVTEATRRPFAAVLAWCAAERKGFQVVPAESLARLTGSLHHEGVAILARQVRRRDFAELLRGIEAGAITGPLLHLDGVQNPHNLGSILRTAAHFGVGAVTGRSGDLPSLSPAAARVAEGAAEAVPICELADSATDLARLRQAGYRVVVTSSHRGEPLFTADLGPRMVVVLGGEGEGVSPALDRLADLRVCIPGTGAVESLNVAVAAGVVLAEIWRREGRSSPTL